MSLWKCTVHNVEYAEPVLPKDATPEFKKFCKGVACPICLREERDKLALALGHAIQHRDALLKAIEIKQEFLTVRSQVHGCGDVS